MRAISGVPCRLVIAPPPRSDEAPRGWHLRLAEANGLPAARWIVGRGTHDEQQAQALLLAGLGQEDAPLHREASVRRPALRYGAPFDRAYMRANRPHVCPACLKESPVLRAEWDLLFWTVCPVHRDAMASGCRCGRKLGWDRASVTRCRCGADLRDWPATPASPAEADLVASLGEKLSLPAACGDAGMSALLRGCDAGDLVSCVRILAGAAMGSRQGADPVKMRPKEAVRVAAGALAHWPEGFRAYLGDCDAATPHARARRVVQWLGKGIPGDRPTIAGLKSALVGEVEALAYEDASSSAPDPDPGPDLPGEGLTMARAASILGIDRADLVRLSDRRLVRVGPSLGNQFAPRIRRHEVERIRAAGAQGLKDLGPVPRLRDLDLKSAARALGVGAVSIRKLMAAGLVETAGAGARRRVGRRSLERLRSAIDAASAPGAADGQRLVGWQEAALGPARLGLVEVLEAVLRGAVRPIPGPSEALSDIRFASAEIEALAGARRAIGAAAAMRMLRCQNGDLGRLVDAGLVELIEPRTGPLRLRSNVSLESLKDVSRRFASTAALADENGLSPRAAAAALRRGGLAPAAARDGPSTTDFWPRGPAEACLGRRPRPKSPEGA